LGGLRLDDDFEASIRRHVERYRMAGHDLEIDGPRYVSLEIDMHVCAEPEYFRADVKGEVAQSSSAIAYWPIAVSGIFHPDQFTFVRLST